MLIGHGWDLHQHSENKTLKLGGVNFDEDGFEGIYTRRRGRGRSLYVMETTTVSADDDCELGDG